MSRFFAIGIVVVCALWVAGSICGLFAACAESRWRRGIEQRIERLEVTIGARP